jgi:rhodanese-related sulfurtransferase
MFGRSAKPHREISPAELHRMLAANSVLLVDVREPDEFAAGHIAGAVNLPLSSFTPSNVPDADGRTVVLQCAGGKRSGIALERCAAARSVIDSHLEGGIGTWAAAGFPVVLG